MYVCVYIYAYVCKYICTFVHACMCVYVCIMHIKMFGSHSTFAEASTCP